MEISQSLSCKLLHKNLYYSAPILPSRVPSIPLSLITSTKSFSKLVDFWSAVRRQRRIIGPFYASGIRAYSADDGERWLLEPVGGDSRHIVFKVQMPDAFEIASVSLSIYIFVCNHYLVIFIIICFARMQLPSVGFLRKRIWSYRWEQHKRNIHQRETIKTRSGNSHSPREPHCLRCDIHLAMFLVLKLDDVKPPTDAERISRTARVWELDRNY